MTAREKPALKMDFGQNTYCVYHIKEKGHFKDRTVVESKGGNSTLDVVVRNIVPNYETRGQDVDVLGFTFYETLHGHTVIIFCRLEENP